MSPWILLVEDNDDDIVLTRMAFRDSHIANDVVVARDGAEALDCLVGKKGDDLRSERGLPQVVLLDLNLPRVGGLDVLRRLRQDERTKYLAVVVLTSSQEEEDIVRSYSLGANGFVRKPIDFEEFARAAKALGLFWLALNRTPASTRSA